MSQAVATTYEMDRILAGEQRFLISDKEIPPGPLTIMNPVNARIICTRAHDCQTIAGRWIVSLDAWVKEIGDMGADVKPA